MLAMKHPASLWTTIEGPSATERGLPDQVSARWKTNLGTAEVPDWLPALATDLARAMALDDELARPKACAEALSRVRGFFAVVVTHPTWVIAAVDRVRSMPLIWTAPPGRALPVIGQTAAELPLGEAHAVRPEQALSVALSGYTTGSDALLDGVGALQPGQALIARAGEPARALSYHRFDPWRGGYDAVDSPADARRGLADLTLRLLEETARRAGNRQIAVPLSAGFDSRAIASGFKELGLRNVICFAYGRHGNREAQTSREIARRLGFPWHFVPYTPAGLRPVFGSDPYAAFKAASDSLTGIHFPQDYPALVRLLQDGVLQPDAVVVNGQTGDFISGNHIPPALMGMRAWGDASREAVIDALITKHYKHWEALQTPACLAPIRDLLRAEIDTVIGDAADPAPFGVCEAVEFRNRQSKYVINGQRAYEVLGLGWDLPLWADDYLEFWAGRPLAEKARQTLYRESLLAADWGDVWHSVPLNTLRVRPNWLVPIRLALKAAHAPLGRAAWHRFERRFLGTIMDPLCTTAEWPWRRFAWHPLRPTTPLALIHEAYLNGHGIRLDALPCVGEFAFG